MAAVSSPRSGGYSANEVNDESNWTFLPRVAGVTPLVFDPRIGAPTSFLPRVAGVTLDLLLQCGSLSTFFPALRGLLR